jgi:Zn-finger nucleic acid-binding protein
MICKKCNVEMVKRIMPLSACLIDYYDCPQCKFVKMDVPIRGGPERIQGSRAGLAKMGIKVEGKSVSKVQETDESA